MKLTSLQNNLLNVQEMTKIVFKKMYKKYKELGYTSTQKNLTYFVTIAADAPTEDVKMITLLHELGHIILGHIDINIDEEIKEIKNILGRKEKSIESFCKRYEGFMTFLNICMDLEVNSKYLTIANIKYMNDYFSLCTTDSFNVPIKDNFREYYEILINKLDDDEDYKKEIMKDISKKPSNNLPQEIKDSLEKENYFNNFKQSSSEMETGESSVKNFANVFTGAGKNHKEDIEYINTALKEIPVERKIENFLKDIIITENDILYKRNIMKHFNRKTRENSSNILYSSLRQNHVYIDKKKLGILIDVSNSMNTSNILKAVKTLKHYNKNLDEDSMVVTWDTDLIEQFNIKSIPNQIRNGRGTEISSGINYLVNKGFKDIVIYSDFDTPLKAFTKVINNKNVNFYFIIVKNSYREAFYKKLESLTSKIPTLII